MCNIDVYPGGERKKHRCQAYRRGEACQESYYHHTTPAPINIPRRSGTYHHLPPSPRLTPGSSPMVGSYHSSPRASHHESDSDSSHRRRRHRRGPSVLINGEPVTPRDSSTSSHRRGSSTSSHRRYESGGRPRERIIIVENPPTQRTPPQQHAIPRTAPSSPSPLHEGGFRNNPVIVDDRHRPERRVRISVPPSPDATTSSGSSSGSGRRRVRRREREEEDERVRGEAEEDARRRRRDARIEQANRNIAGRPEQPMPRRPEPQPPRRASTAYVRPTVEIPTVAGVGLGVGTEDVTARMRGMSVEDKEEQEAMTQRLRERIMPQRRASIGAASRRHRVQYEDGMYRLE